MQSIEFFLNDTDWLLCKILGKIFFKYIFLFSLVPTYNLLFPLFNGFLQNFLTNKFVDNRWSKIPTTIHSFIHNAKYSTFIRKYDFWLSVWTIEDRVYQSVNHEMIIKIIKNCLWYDGIHGQLNRDSKCKFRVF